MLMPNVLVDLQLSVSVRCPTVSWEETWLGNIRNRDQSAYIPDFMERLLLYRKDFGSWGFCLRLHSSNELEHSSD